MLPYSTPPRKRSGRTRRSDRAAGSPVSRHRPRPMPQHNLDILYEDNHLLAVNKPAGLADHGRRRADAQAWARGQGVFRSTATRSRATSIWEWSAAWTRSSRAWCCWRATSKAAARLTEQFRSRSVEKTYWAVVTGWPEPPAGELVDWLDKDESRQRMAVAAAPGGQGQQAVLRYRVLRRVDRGVAASRSNWSPAASIRFGSRWPLTDTRSWAIANTAARCHSPAASRCMPGDWRSSIRRAASRWSWLLRCRPVGGGGGWKIKSWQGRAGVVPSLRNLGGKIGLPPLLSAPIFAASGQ